MNHTHRVIRATDEYQELAHTLIDDFLNLKGPRTFSDKLPVMNQIIETFNLQIEPEQLYSLYECTLIIPELKELSKLIENAYFYNMIVEQKIKNQNTAPPHYGCSGLSLMKKFMEKNELENININNYENVSFMFEYIEFYNQNIREQIHYGDILNVVMYYKLFFKKLLYRNKFMFVAFIKYFNNKIPIFNGNIYSLLNVLTHNSIFKILAISKFFAYPINGIHSNNLLLGVFESYRPEVTEIIVNKQENKKLYKIDKLQNGTCLNIAATEHKELLTYELYPLNTLDCHLTNPGNYNYLSRYFRKLQTYHEELLQKNNITFTNIKKAIK